MTQQKPSQTNRLTTNIPLDIKKTWNGWTVIFKIDGAYYSTFSKESAEAAVNAAHDLIDENSPLYHRI